MNTISSDAPSAADVTSAVLFPETVRARLYCAAGGNFKLKFGVSYSVGRNVDIQLIIAAAGRRGYSKSGDLLN